MLGKTFDTYSNESGQANGDKRKKFGRNRSQSLFPVTGGSLLGGSLIGAGSIEEEGGPQLAGGRSQSHSVAKAKPKLRKGESEIHSTSRRFSKLPGMLKATDEPTASNTPESKDRSSANKKIEVHAYTEDPTTAWEMLKAKRPVKLVRPMPLSTPVKEEAVRFVCLSDVHSRALDARAIPPGDVLLVGGDFTTVGHPHELKAFLKFLGKLPHKYKIVIAGNHECTFDPSFMKSSGLERLMGGGDSREEQLRQSLKEALAEAGIPDPKALFTSAPGITYLEDEETTVFGLTIYGSPWVPRADSWAFNLPRGQALLDKWNAVPPNVDVLLTHTPPLGHGDMTGGGVRAGCVELLNSVCSRIRPKYHVFGHIHDDDVGDPGLFAGTSLALGPPAQTSVDPSSLPRTPPGRRTALSQLLPAVSKIHHPRRLISGTPGTTAEPAAAPRMASNADLVALLLPSNTLRTCAGCTTDGYTKFINACICDNKMRPSNPPIIFDVPVPDGGSKTKLHSVSRPRLSIG